MAYTFLIRTDQPFQGHAQSVLTRDGTVAWTNGLTVEQYEQQEGFPLRAIDEAEMTRLVDAFHDTIKTRPTPISEERYWEMLEVLPPCRWHNAGGFEFFHVSEHITGNLVSWFAHKGNQYWEFTEDCNLPSKALVALVTA